MAYSYRWQYCDMDFLRHCLKKYSLLLEKIPSAILTEETTGTQMFVTEFLSDCIKRCDDGFDDYTMTALLPEGAATVTLQENRDTVRRLSTRYHGEYAALLPEMAAYYFSKAGRQQRRDTEQALGKRCFAFFDYAYNRMLEAQFLRHDFRWVGGEIPSVNHLKTLSDAADLTEALGQFRREEYDRRKEHDFSHAKLCTFLETRFEMLYFENRFAAYLLQPVSGAFSGNNFPKMNLTTGPAKKICHKSAIGKFKTVVWNHAATSSFPGCLNKTVATRLMVGHIHKTIMHEMASVITNGRSFGVTIWKAIAVDNFSTTKNSRIKATGSIMIIS